MDWSVSIFVFNKQKSTFLWTILRSYIILVFFSWLLFVQETFNTLKGNPEIHDGGSEMAPIWKSCVMCLVSYDMITSRYEPQLKSLIAAVCEDQTNSKSRGKGGHGKFDFFHILMLDRLGYY